jgi:hypothetical protein
MKFGGFFDGNRCDPVGNNQLTVTAMDASVRVVEIINESAINHINEM